MISLQDAILGEPDAIEAYSTTIPEGPRSFMNRLALDGSMFAHFCSSSEAVRQEVFDAIGGCRQIDRSKLRDMDKLNVQTMQGIAEWTINELYRLFRGKMQQGYEQIGIPPWAQCIKTDIHNLLETLREAARVTVVADRETLNTASIIDHANEHRDLQLAGVVTPFHELDEKVIPLFERVNDLHDFGVGTPMHVGDHVVDFHFTGPCTDQALFLHAPYDAKKIKTVDGERRRYCEEVLLPHILETRPDVVLLSNFKIILDGIIPQELERRGIKLINGHPSVLPLNKGWRTEKLAMLGTNPDASGYTFHYVTEELDGGATLLQQHVPLPQLDQKEMEGEHREGYVKKQEEILRLRTIRAQARHIAQVIQAVTSGAKQKILQGDDAFAAEGRKRPYGFDEDYYRVVFDHGDGFQTLEQHLNVPTSANTEPIGHQRVYTLFVPGTHKNVTDLLEVAQSHDGTRGMTSHLTAEKQTGGYMVRVETVHPTLHEWLWKNGLGDYTVEDEPVGVVAPRKPNPHKPLGPAVFVTE